MAADVSVAPSSEAFADPSVAAPSEAPADWSVAPTTVAFDIGNVLVDWNPRAFFATRIADPIRLDRFLAEIATTEWHKQHDAGRDFAETSAELIALFPEEADNIRLWGERFDDQVGPVLPGMAEIVADLAARDVPLYAITNYSHEFFPSFAKREAALLAPFRDILVSGEVKLIKPDPAIYALALERFGLVAGEALFIDDRPENIVAAEAGGFVGHVFHNAEKLRIVLEQLHLL